MIKKLKSLYIHIPFCKSICTYCYFVRSIPKTATEIDKYLDYLIQKIKIECKNKKFETIYIGGGTPNCLSKLQLSRLLNECHDHLAKNGEFTIECNPEFVTDIQAKILKKYNVNRVSLGAQTLNPKILKLFNRKHNNTQLIKSIKALRKHNINNINVDFIYGFNLMNIANIKEAIDFIKIYKIPHVSFYSLELKEGSILNKLNYQINEEKNDQQFKFIIQYLKKSHYKRYEVSNWCLDKSFICKHNLSYWKSNDWKAIGLGAYGLENKNYYFYYKNKQNKICKQNTKLSLKDYYFQIISMGLRLIEGIDLKIDKNKKAFEYFKTKIDPKLIKIKNNKLIAKNINQLDNILIEII